MRSDPPRRKICSKELAAERRAGMTMTISARLERFFPRYARLPLALALAFQFLVYYGGRMLSAGRVHYDLTLPADALVPFVPGMIVVYVGCYLFWAYNYILATRFGRAQTLRFLRADVMAKLVCLLFFVLLPVTLTRPQVAGTDVFSRLVRLIYAVDSPNNLFPSIHCVVSWLCYTGIRGQRAVPRWYRAFSCVFALLVFASTVMVRQHVLVDVVAGWLLAEGCCRLSARLPLGRFGREAA